MTKGLLVAVGLLLAGVASAQDQAPMVPVQPAMQRPPGYQTHDGFYLSLGLGVGAATASASQGGLSVDLSGGGAVFNVALGGAMNPNFLLGGRAFSILVSEPSVELNGADLGNSTSDLGLVGYGVDLTYYFDNNFFVGGTPAVTRLRSTDGSTSSSSDWGFGLRLAAGKEWWVSDNWGLGLNLEYVYSANRDSGAGTPTWGTNWLGVAFSATFN